MFPSESLIQDSPVCPWTLLHLSRPSEPSVHDLPLVTIVFESQEVRVLSLQEGVELLRLKTCRLAVDFLGSRPGRPFLQNRRPCMFLFHHRQVTPTGH